jgi:hypothetical protein
MGRGFESLLRYQKINNLDGCDGENQCCKPAPENSADFRHFPRRTVRYMQHDCNMDSCRGMYMRQPPLDWG